MSFKNLSDEKLDELLEEYMKLVTLLIEEQHRRQSHEGLVDSTRGLIDLCLQLGPEHNVADVKKKLGHQG